MGWTRQEVLDVARSTGRPVVEAWSTHNAGQMGTVLGPMLHHTGSKWTYPTNTAPTLKTVREGRSDLQNALCMYYIDYAGVIYCVTEKIAWHAGAGSWQGVTDGNGHFAGIEAESDGVQWTKATTASYKRLAAAILRKTGRTVAYAPRHADYALPKGRKTDFSGMDPAGFLADVNADLAGNPTSEDDMAQEDRDLINYRIDQLAGFILDVFKAERAYNNQRFNDIAGHVTGQAAGVTKTLLEALNQLPGITVTAEQLRPLVAAALDTTVTEISDEAARKAADALAARLQRPAA